MSKYFPDYNEGEKDGEEDGEEDVGEKDRKRIKIEAQAKDALIEKLQREIDALKNPQQNVINRFSNNYLEQFTS